LGRRVCRDATDDGILACARAARVDYLVTGDRDLLTLRTFAGIPIIPPRSFEALFTE
jgi:predicted nucleic acid-binding protein